MTGDQGKGYWVPLLARMGMVQIAENWCLAVSKVLISHNVILRIFSKKQDCTISF